MALGNTHLRGTLLVVSLVLIPSFAKSFGQDSPQRLGPPKVELLALSGSSPSLSSSGEGISSIKVSQFFESGLTQVKPLDPRFKIELPVGYTLFNNLAFLIETAAVFSGPNDYGFKVPSASSKEVFDKLRVLVADYDEAQPQRPKWIDVTLTAKDFDQWKQYLSQTEFDERLPNFATSSLHGFMWQRSLVFVVATKESSLARDNLLADLAVTAIPDPSSVMEGRDIRYTFTVTNNGPDAATQVTFKSQVGPDFVSLEQSQGICRWEAYNIYCDLGEIPNGAKAIITFRGRCDWNSFFGDQPKWPEGMRASTFVGAAERDPNYENNQVFATASIVKDPNQAPVVTIVSPTEDQFFVGPGVNVNLVANAYDPDGAISKIEFFDGGQLIGAGRMTGKDKYELIYPNVSYGQHFPTAVVVDNQGRPGKSQLTSFFVNGQAKVQIVSPSAKQIIRGPLQDIVVTLQASDPVKQIKKVTVHLGTYLGGIPQDALPGSAKDEYTTTFKGMGGPGTHTFYVVVTDDAGIQTVTYPVDFKVTEHPQISLYHFDGEYARDIVGGTVFPASRLELGARISHSGYYLHDEPSIVKVEFYANGRLICRDEKKKDYNFDSFECSWRARPGTYTLVGTATDSDGEVGKSTPVQVVIR